MQEKTSMDVMMLSSLVTKIFIALLQGYKPGALKVTDHDSTLLCCVFLKARGPLHVVLHGIVFIHFYSASHSMSLSEALPTTAIDTVSEFTHRSATGNCK